jgi:type II secretory pathway component PulC
MDPRQKKMTIMVGVLSLVFAVVLVISLGGLGGGRTRVAGKENSQKDTGQLKPMNGYQWHTPQPLPAQLRNPMVRRAEQIGQNTASAGGPMLVKGIVFSKNNPTAIIDSRVVAQGESIDGVKVVTINKDSVEFEKDGKRWVQQVQR